MGGRPVGSVVKWEGCGVKGNREAKNRRSYRPTVEALEALRLLSTTAQVIPGVPLAQDVFAASLPTQTDLTTPSAAWDEALSQSDLSELLGPSYSAIASPSTTDPQDIASGLSQLNRYLSRTWYRAGVPVQAHDDCTQAVYVTLLQNLGRDRFDLLVSDIGQHGIRDVLSRETNEGPDFFRAIDTVKKRAQRERTYQPLDTLDIISTNANASPESEWRDALREAIDETLTPREASLVNETLMGKTPAEIAQLWGVAPKTVSNEKTRVIQKLREALVADLLD